MLFAERLKLCRENRKWKQREVADAVHVNLRTYQGYEGGRSEPKFETLIALADLFDVTLDYLLGRTEQ